MFDLLIKNASIVDGAGAPAFSGSVAVKDGRFAAVGDVDGEAVKTIDASGQVVCPGFIDIHSHTDAGLLVDPTAQSKVTQGITFELCGQCGFSSGPDIDEASRAESDIWRRRHGIRDDWESLGEFLSILESRRIGVNFATLVGHSNLRGAVVGYADREATQSELDGMKSLVAQAMREGAFGLSTGLQYAPSCFGTTDEIAQVASAVAPLGGIYASHTRDERDAIYEAVEEAIEIGRRSGAPVQISHLKGYGSGNSEKTLSVLNLIEEARQSGLDVTADQYPYIASSTGLSIFLPAWAHDGGDDLMLQRICARREELLKSLSSMSRHGVWDSVRIGGVRTDANRQYEGMSITEVSRARGKSPEETVLSLLTEESGAVSIVHFSQWEGDVVAVMRTDFAMFGTDASARSTKGELAKGKPHPRSFGSFPRVLGRYVREQNVIPLETAIRKMTSMPAAKLGLTDRGVLKPGAWADMVVFDPNAILDTATYEHPHQVSTGISRVFVNGRLAVENGELTGVLAGHVIRNTASRRQVYSEYATMKIFRNPEYRGLFVMLLVILAIGFVMSVWTGKFEQWTGISLLTGPRALDQIAFVCDRANSPEICLMKPDGKGMKQLTTGAFVRSEPAVSPSGTKIVFVARLDGKDQVFSVGARGGRPNQLTSATGPKKQPGFTPNGKSLSFISSGKVYRADLNGDSPDTVLPSEAETHAAMSDPLKTGDMPAYYSYAWAPDSAVIVGVTKDASGNDVVAYLPAPDKPPVMLPLGPLVNGLLKQSGQDRTLKRRIASDDRIKVTGIVWASAVPAFAISIVSRNDGFLVICGVQEGKLGVSGFQAFPGHEIGMAAFSPDGTSLVIPIHSTGGKSADGLVRLDTSNGQLAPVAPGSFMRPSFSPDGGRLLATRLDRKTETRDIVAIDMSTGKLTQLTHDGGSHDAVWTPASKPRESQ